MPIKIPNDLPARAVLDRERVPVIIEDVALRQDIRPLQIALLNLMPDKVRTETQLLCVLGTTPLQIEMTLLRAANHQSRNTSSEHLTAFYKIWNEVRDRRFDALIITVETRRGASIGTDNALRSSIIASSSGAKGVGNVHHK